MFERSVDIQYGDICDFVDDPGAMGQLWRFNPVIDYDNVLPLFLTYIILNKSRIHDKIINREQIISN